MTEREVAYSYVDLIFDEVYGNHPNDSLFRAEVYKIISREMSLAAGQMIYYGEGRESER